MPRQTRAARRAEAAAAAPLDNVAVDAPDAPDMHAPDPVPEDHHPSHSKQTQDRNPISEIEANNVDAPELHADVAAADAADAQPAKMPPKRSKSKKGGKKGAKGKKADPEKPTEAEQQKFNGAEDEVKEEAQVEVVLEDERQAAGSPASDAARDKLVEPPSEGASRCLRGVYGPLS